MSQRTARAFVLTLALGVAVAGCGLKPEVKDQLSSGQLSGAPAGSTTGGVVDDSTGTGGSLPGATTGSTGGTETTGTGTTGSTGTGTTGTSGTTGTTGTSGTTGTTGVPVKGTTTGIDFKNKIVHIKLHGPLTGAGVPQDSFKSGTVKYWQTHKLANGFKVDAVAVDDKYNAADASRACNAAADDSFLMIGGAGTDQISACAQSPKLRRLHMPYLSSGVTEAGLGNISTYHATSLTYKQQAPLVVRLAKDRGEFTDKKWAMVITSTPNFKDAREAFAGELVRNGAKGKVGAFNPKSSTEGGDIFLTDKAPTTCSIATQIRAGGYQSIFFLGQPTFFALCVQAVGSKPINPYYTGPGPSFGITSVINLACTASGGEYKGVYLHPSPSVQGYASKVAPGTTFKDDIELGIWGGMEQVKRVFDSVTGPLTRESFNAALDGRVFTGYPHGVLHTVDYRTSRFGGTAAFANAADCQTKTSKTIGVYRK
jgi:branched-chain amino acid transport system substrate-binding protein